MVKLIIKKIAAMNGYINFNEIVKNVPMGRFRPRMDPKRVSLLLRLIKIISQYLGSQYFGFSHRNHPPRCNCWWNSKQICNENAPGISTFLFYHGSNWHSLSRQTFFSRKQCLEGENLKILTVKRMRENDIQ